MRRRDLLAAVPIALAGCSASGSTDEPTSSDPTDRETTEQAAQGGARSIRVEDWTEGTAEYGGRYYAVLAVAEQDPPSIGDWQGEFDDGSLRWPGTPSDPEQYPGLDDWYLPPDEDSWEDPDRREGWLLWSPRDDVDLVAVHVDPDGRPVMSWSRPA